MPNEGDFHPLPYGWVARYRLDKEREGFEVDETPIVGVEYDEATRGWVPVTFDVESATMTPIDASNFIGIFHIGVESSEEGKVLRTHSLGDKPKHEHNWYVRRL